MFGLPVPEASDAAADGQLVLGGCIVSDEPPNWQCAQQHRWRDEDLNIWEQQLLAVLVARGYREARDEP
jgi:hypothetical protein